MIFGDKGRVQLPEDAKGVTLNLADMLRDALESDRRLKHRTNTHLTAENVEFWLRQLAK